jgi:hypothetical protein
MAQRQLLLEPGIKLPLDPLTTRMGFLSSVDPSRGRSSPAVAIVVRRAAPFRMGADRGLRTLFFQSESRSLFTIRRAALAENMLFSFGGLLAAVGLRRR